MWSDPARETRRAGESLVMLPTKRVKIRMSFSELAPVASIDALHLQ